MATKTKSSPSSASGFVRLLGRLAPYLPVLLAVLLMLPRLIAPHFGLFDDGRTLVTADRISHGTWYTGKDSIEGRFRPIHWLWFTLSYLVGGKNPFWFYLANTLALAGIVGGLILLVRAAGGSKTQAGLAGLFFALAGPVVETFFTLKGEVVQGTLMLLALLAACLYARARSRWGKIGAVALTALLLLMTDLTKETAIVLLPVSVVWVLLERFWPGREKNPGRRAVLGAYLVANLIAVPVFFLLRTLAVSEPITGGTYSGRYAFQLGQIAVSALRWAGWLVRDFTWVVPLVLLAILLLLLRRKPAGSVLLLESFVWMGAWICIYLPWDFMAEYYMLPFALGSAVLAAGLAVGTVSLLRQGGWARWAGVVALGLSALLLAGNLLNNLTNARVQMAVDSADSSMMAYLIEQTAPDSLVLVNIQDPNEYFVEMQTQLGQVDGRPDLSLVPFSRDPTLPTDGTPVYIVTPFVMDQPLLTVRMGIVEDTQNMWNYSLDEYFHLSPGWQLVNETRRAFRLSDVNYPRLFCPFVKTRSFCATPAPLIDTRPFAYGWRIYKLETP